MLQSEALEVLKTGANVFLTGEPGSGKTYTINAYIAWLQRNNVWPAVTASTGIAATHLGGATIHSWSGIGIREDITAQDIDALLQNERIVKRIRNTAVLIIDEVSMLSCTTLDMVNTVVKAVRESELPFGGMQIVFVGDFFQLPPVVKRQYRRDAMDFDTASYSDGSEYNTDHAFAFLSRAWNEANVLTCYLDEQHRQADTTFLEILTAIRTQSYEEMHHELLSKRIGKPQSATHLYAHNVNVDMVNAREIAKLPGKERMFVMTGTGSKFLIEKLKNGCLSPEHLPLKVGAKVMFTKNDPEGRYANGTLGEVVSFDSPNHFPVVETRDGRTLVAEPVEWRLDDQGAILANIRQVPLRLAWAITIHKSQGMSLDAAHIDLTNIFEHGQGYVALSRVRTLDGITLTGVSPQSLTVHPAVIEKDIYFKEHSRATAAAFAEMTEAEKKEMHKRFIGACKGVWCDDDTATVPTRKAKLKKKATHEDTLALMRERFSLSEAARARGLTENTILDHLETCLREGICTSSAFAHLAKGIENDIARIHRICDTIGHEKLKPIFDAGNGAYSYTTIKIARLLYER